jgi:hypothetical protein
MVDFEGCSIDGEPTDSCYEWFSYSTINTQGQSTHGHVLHLVMQFTELEPEDRHTMSSRHQMTDISRLHSHTQTIASRRHVFTSGPVDPDLFPIGGFTSMSKVLRELEYFALTLSS